MASRFTLPREQGFDANGDPLPGGKLYFYVSGTSTPQNTYSDNALTTPNANPVVADSAGRWGDIFLADADYKVILKDSSDVTIWTADPVRGPAGASEATQNEVDARTASDKYVSPRRLAEGLGLQGTSIASASALSLPAIGDYFSVTGTTTITSISTRTAGRRVTLVFTGAVQLTHSSNLKMPGAINYTTVADDVLEFVSEGSGVWRMIDRLPIQLGTWAPVIAGATTPGTHTYTSQVGSYVRIGNLVWVTAQAQINTKDGTMAGNVVISGLPFTSSASLNVAMGVEFSGVNLSAGYTALAIVVAPASTAAAVNEEGDNVSVQAVGSAAIANGTLLIMSGVYKTG